MDEPEADPVTDTARVLSEAEPVGSRAWRLPAAVVDAAAAACRVEAAVLARAVAVAVSGGPDARSPGWWRNAACRGEGPQRFYPTRGRPVGALVDRCRDCPVQAECLAAALATGERDGVWGGTTGNGRRRLRGVLRRAGVLGLVGEDAHIAWRQEGADREPPPLPGSRAGPVDPWPHQLAAVDAIAAAITDGGSCQVATATASGKTLIAVWAAARLGARRVLVLVPNLALVAQSAETWSNDPAWTSARVLAVCSDVGELVLEATTDPGRVRSFLAGPGPAVVFATYQSSPVAAAAGRRFDLVVADEAHHLAGAPDKAFATVVRGDIPANRVLYMTATPRRLTRGRRRDVEVVSMDSAGSSFGPRVFDFSLSNAIAAGVVADYRVVVAAVERDVFDRVARRPELAGIDPVLLAGAIAVVRAMDEFGLSSCLSFHSRVDRARSFAQLVGAVTEALPGAHPAGPGWSGWVHGGSSVRIRRRLLARLADPDTWGVLANAKALGEGVDLPALDAVAIVDPKNSDTDILQATGRALRRPHHSKIGTVLLPVLVTTDTGGDDPMAGVDRRSVELVGGVLRALRAHDHELARRLDGTRRLAARTGSAQPELAAMLRRRAARALLASRVELWVPGGATGDLAASLALRLVREATPSWEEAYGRLLAWVDDHGTARTPQAVKVPDGDATFSLGAWCTVQRTLHRRGLLGPERVERLEALPGWRWDPRHEDWWAGYDALADFVDRHAGRYPRQGDRWLGHPVGQFLNVCRTGHNTDGWLRTFPDRVTALETLPGWAWNERDAAWEDHYRALAGWAAARGHACPGDGELVDGFDLGRWTTKQRAKLRRGDLDPNRTARLRALPGWVDHTRDALWEQGYARLVAWSTTNNDRLPPQTTILADGYQLGVWVSSQRERWRTGRLTEQRTRRLEALPCWDWTPGALAWDAAHARLVAFADRHGTVGRLPQGNVDGFALSAWATTQRRDHALGRLDATRAVALERVPGWVWSVPEARFAAALAAVRAFATRAGHCDPPSDHRENGVPLRAWITRVRRQHQLGELSATRAAQLATVPGWTWRTDRTRTAATHLGIAPPAADAGRGL
ncbi:MAG: Helicase associated domain protein [Acidimicrobiales bacterium]